MPLYETTVVVDSTLEESAVNEKIQGIVDLLTQSGATDIRQDRRGVRKLAYEIKGKDGEMRVQADYTFLIYEAAGNALRVLEDHLRLDEDILRYMTVRYEHLPPAEDERPSDAPGEKGGKDGKDGATDNSDSEE